MGERTSIKCGPFAWCKSMEDRLQVANARAKGLAACVVTNFETGAMRTVGIAYKTSANDPGLLLNRCPWCGEDIAPAASKEAP